ncbi:MAG: serine/threonine-protein kinase [Gemmatimonadaceae bacterium]|nr:serine/threonine-protein kinase [Gemmatimonadaceae bacterium]
MTDSLTLLTAALADRYRVTREIGAGGMATVYLAQDLKHERDVAIKVLHPDLGAALGAERFLSEIRTTARLQHPNILALLDSGDADGLLYYVMPLVEGETLRQRLDREKQLPLDAALRIAGEVADALGYAHRQGVIHRDIKPENILLHDGRPVVADFGIALAVQSAGGTRMTQTGLSLGTPQYMSPEQAMGERTIDARSDLYALGAVMYEMLTGEPPFTGATVQAIVAKVLTERPSNPSAVRDTIPRHVEATVLRALAKLPADRWATATEFAHALQHPEATAAFTAAHAAESSVPPAATSRARTLTVALSVATMASAAVALWAWNRPVPEPPISLLTMAIPDSQRLIEVNALRRFALSRDGTQLAYVGSYNNSSVVYVRALDDTIPRRIRGTEGASMVRWSPTGSELLFAAFGLGVRRVGATGGAATIVAERGTPTDWGEHGDILITVDNAIWRVTRAGERALVARPDSGTGETFRDARFLPGDRDVVFTVTSLGGGPMPTSVAVVSVDEGDVTRLGIGGGLLAVANGFLLVGQQGTLVAHPFTASRRAVTGPPVTIIEGVQQGNAGVSAAVSEEGTLIFGSGGFGRRTLLVAVNREGKERALAEPRRYSWPRISPDGRRVAVEVEGETGGYDVWLLDLASRAMSRLTTNYSGVRPLGWSPDGKSVGFLSTSDNTGSIIGAQRTVSWIPFDLSGPRRTLPITTRNPVEDASISAASGAIAIRTLGYGAPGEILLAPADSPRVAQPLVATAADEETPRFSPNGAYLAYASDETGNFEVYVRPVAGAGGRVQISAGGGSEPVWARDGRGIYYRGPARLMFAALDARAEVVRRDTLFLDPYRKEHRAVAYDVFPGGQEFLMQRVETEGRRDLMVLRNWPALARRRQQAMAGK